MRKKKKKDVPEIDLLKAELRRERYKIRYASVLRNTVFSLVVVAAFAILVATLWMPVLQIYGSSMTPTLQEGDIVLTMKGNNYEVGDLVSFYIGNKLLVKRYIAGPGQWVDIDADGNVYVDGQLQYEPYLDEKSLGDTDLEYPYQVPDNRIFVLGDHRVTSVDSRNSVVGCIAEEQMVGKIVFRVWPFSQFGLLNE